MASLSSPWAFVAVTTGFGIVAAFGCDSLTKPYPGLPNSVTAASVGVGSTSSGAGGATSTSTSGSNGAGGTTVG